MNTLSWFIYFIDVTTGINIVLAFLVFVIIPIGVVTKLVGAFQEVDYDYTESYRKSKKIILQDRHPFTVKSMMIVWALLVGISIFVPNKQTLVLIAASEYGEKIVNNPKVQTIVDPSIDLLKTWIEKEKKNLIDDAVGEKKK